MQQIRNVRRRKLLGLRRHGTRKTNNRRRLIAGFAALGLAAALAGVGPASAVHDEGFELEGNVANNGALDWVDLFDVNGNPTVTTPKASLPAPFIAASFKKDFVLPDTSGYATGTKDILGISPGWQCKTPNNLGSKFDIVNAYAGAMVPTSGDASGDLIITFGSEISAPEGNRNSGLWLLQDPDVGCTGAGNTDFTGSHTDGDVFIVSAFTGGGAIPNIDVYRWNAPDPDIGEGDTGGSLVKTDSFANALCVDPGGPATIVTESACAIANTDGDKTGAEPFFDIDPPWDAPDKDGGDLNEAQFVEGAVNLSELELEGCFSTFLANSRSSQETTSTLHDFATDEFETCGALRWLKHDGDGALLGGATFEVCGPDSTLPADCVSVVDNTGQAGYSGLDVDATAGEFEMADLPAGDYTIRETAAPPGYQLDPDTETVTVGLGGTSSPTTPFVNPGLYKVIVITCNTATDKLVDSTVDLDPNSAGGVKATLTLGAADPLHATLCRDDGASYDNLTANNYDLQVELPDVAPLFP